ncbi:MAG: Hint domain-containing protein, partial [Brevundimonas sp.]
YWLYRYLVGDGNGNYRIWIGPPSTNYETLVDVSDGPADGLTQLGDISDDRFQLGPAFGGVFEGSLIGGGVGFVGSNAIGFYIVYYGNSFEYADNQMVLFDPNIPFDIACYLTGTAIRTTSGDVAVEALTIGDEVVTASGQARPIKWIGRRSYAGRFANGNADVLPVCFKAGSISDNVPARDLHVSPRHAMFIDGVLIAAERLVNGVTITQATEVDEVTYWHIELDSHDVLIAEGAASESFVDDNSRAMFHNAAEFAALYPDSEQQPAVYCAPRVQDGHALHAVWTRLARRAGIAVVAAEDLGELTGEVSLSDGRITGWAVNGAHPKAPVCLDLIADGVLVGRMLARDQQAFSHPLPSGAEGASSLVVRRSADGAVLGAVSSHLADARAA